MSTNTSAIIESFKNGSTLQEIGIKHDLTRERIRQIVKAHGLSRLDGGSAIRSLKSIQSKVQKKARCNLGREVRSRKLWGMSREDLVAHKTEYGDSSVAGSPMAAYKNQRSSAKRRGIEWKFTFSEWWQVWVDSGKWEERGRHYGEYVMGRYGDGEVPYSPHTVYICTTSANLKDGFVFNPYEARKNS